MVKRLFALMILVLIVSVNAVSAQDGGSTLQAWGDTPASALDISTQLGRPIYSQTFSQVSAYNITGDPALSCISDHKFSLWHTFVLPRTGMLTIESVGSNFDTMLSVYRTSPTFSSEYQCISTTTDVSESTTIQVQAGTRYYVMISAAGAGSSVDGSSKLTVRYTGNAVLTNAFQIPRSGSYSGVQERIELSNTDMVTNFGCPWVYNTVFYKFRPSVSGRYEITTQGSNYDTVLTVYQGNPPHSMSCTNDINSENVNSRQRMTMTAGTVYYFAIGQSKDSSNLMTDNMTLSLRVRKL
jgi:hypothetical protein